MIVKKLGAHGTATLGGRITRANPAEARDFHKSGPGMLIVAGSGSDVARAHVDSGILQVDGYAGYNRLISPDRIGPDIQLAYCWAHSRRKLHDIYQKDGSEIAAEGLRRIAQIYKIEATVRGRSPEERLAARQAQSAPLIADFRLWLTHQRSRISTKSRLGEKLGYIHRHWDGLQIFLTDGRVEMDTNPVENTIRPITLNRKRTLRGS